MLLHFFFGRCLQPGSVLQTGVFFFWFQIAFLEEKKDKKDKKRKHRENEDTASGWTGTCRNVSKQRACQKRKCLSSCVERSSSHHYCLFVWQRIVMLIFWFGCIEYTAEGLSAIQWETVQTLLWTFPAGSLKNVVFVDVCGVPAQLTKERDEILAAATLDTVVCEL